MRGLFVTFEGIEGSGKTTHMGLAAERLASEGYPVVRTREPGGTLIGERIRSVLLSPDYANMSPVAELLLYEACRAQLIAEHIRPELEKGGLVQAREFSDAVAISDILIAKLDGTAKGGIAFAVAKELGTPIAYVGTGEKPADLAEFRPETYVDSLFFGSEEGF